MEGIFRDEIEVRQIDKFFCAEMGRQIHRYIKSLIFQSVRMLSLAISTSTAG